MYMQETKYLSETEDGKTLLVWEVETTSLLRKLFNKPNKIKTYYYAPVAEITEQSWIWQQIPSGKPITSKSLNEHLDDEYCWLNPLTNGKSIKHVTFST